MPVYISLTVTPERLVSVFFKDVIEHLKRQSAPVENIIINVPHVYKRTGGNYIVPEWLEQDPLVIVNRCEDMGPATKLLGYWDKLESEDLLCVVDDDVIYLPNTLEKLLAAHQRFPGTVVTTVVDRHGSPTGYSGYLVQRQTLAIDESDLNDLIKHCFYVDDTWLGKMLRRKGIQLMSLSRNWLASMDRKKTDTHPQWFELCKQTDREALIKKCLCAAEQEK